MLKKIVIPLIIILMLFNMVFPKFSYCLEGAYGSKITAEEATIDKDTFEEDIENGSSDVNGNEKGYNITDSTINSIVKNLVKILNVLPTLGRGIVTIATYDDADSESNKEYGKAFTIQKAVFNKISLLNINFFHNSEDEGDLQKAIKDNIAKMYYFLRNIAIVMSLVVLIYSGIRMALSTFAQAKAKYKMILMDWLISFIILMLTPYLLVLINSVSEVTVGLCEDVLQTMFEDDDERNIEEKLLDKSFTSTEKGWSLLIPTITYWILAFYQIKFFLIYGKRLLMAGLLVVISPLITISYSIDKAGDGQAQALKTWIAEYMMTVFIQPLHALVYLIFMSMACHIMEAAPILSVIFMTTLTRVEKIMRSLFKLENSMATQEMSKTMQFKNLKV